MKINQKPTVRRRLKKHFFWKREAIRCKNPAYFYSKYFMIRGFRMKRLTNNQYGKLINSYMVSAMANRFRRNRRETSYQKTIIDMISQIEYSKLMIDEIIGIPTKYLGNDK